jgi:hypothetical protein
MVKGVPELESCALTLSPLAASAACLEFGRGLGLWKVMLSDGHDEGRNEFGIAD